MYHYGDTQMNIDDAILILKTRLTSKDVATDIWTAIQTCISEFEKPNIQLNDDDTITMTIQQYCDDSNEQFANGVNVGKRALMKSNIAKKMYQTGVNDFTTNILNKLNSENPEIDENWVKHTQECLNKNIQTKNIN